jgi:hypothetical protein
MTSSPPPASPLPFSSDPTPRFAPPAVAGNLPFSRSRPPPFGSNRNKENQPAVAVAPPSQPQQTTRKRRRSSTPPLPPPDEEEIDELSVEEVEEVQEEKPVPAVQPQVLPLPSRSDFEMEVEKYLAALHHTKRGKALSAFPSFPPCVRSPLTCLPCSPSLSVPLPLPPHLRHPPLSQKHLQRHRPRTLLGPNKILLHQFSRWGDRRARRTGGLSSGEDLQCDL